MILANEVQDVQLSGAQNVKEFTIKASAKAFQILSSNLYSNPLGSMIRELSTNAYDAHVMVGKTDEPFHIKLPNSLDPTFKIRDFGPGLSDEEINSVYTTFFESTKTNNNDVVGCLGLGSKSPFGVSDSFTITSYYNGTKTIYSAFLDSSRIPSVAKFHSEETEEENGIEIEVAIKEEDIGYFAREVNNQLKYFKVKPTISGNSNFVWQTDEEYLYEGTNWKMVGRQHSGYYHARAIQGQISYPISTRDMGTKYEQSSRAIKELLEMSILFEVNIGEVNIAPSREALSYDEATVDNILSYAQKVLEELPAMIAKAIEDAPTEWEARLKYESIMSSFGYHSDIRKYINESSDSRWRGIDVSSTELRIDADDIIEYKFFEKNYNGKFRKQEYSKSRDWDAQTDIYYWNVNVVSDKKGLLFYATPDDKAVDARVKQFITDYNSRIRPYIIKTTLPFEELIDKLGNPDMIKVSTLDKVRRAKKVSTTGDEEIQIPMYSDYGWNQSDRWPLKTVDADLTKIDGYYVDLDRFNSYYNGDEITDIKSVVSAAIKLELIDSDKPIVGLRKAMRKKDHNLVNLFDHIKEQFDASGMTMEYYFGSTSSTQYSLVQKILNDNILLDIIINNIDDTSEINRLAQAVKHNQDHDLGRDAKYMMSVLNVNPHQEDLSSLALVCIEKYDMLVECGYYIKKEPAIKYIQQMDLLHTLTNTDKKLF